MTPEQAASLTAHLAEKVCGFTRIDIEPPSWVVMPEAGCRDFAPLTDANDTALAMDAWHRAYNHLSIDTDKHATERPWTATADDGEPGGAEGFGGPAHTMCEAVSEAIGRASGWEGGER